MKARVLAYYLPQYHPIPENDEWWGKGFTEWTNVAKAKPLFRGHWQPHLPADLGFYDLRVPEIREAQAVLARNHGIEGFIYYHYWFGDGRRLLERPFNEVLSSGEPDFPFCLCWANHTWSGVWYGETDRILMQQCYGGRKDYTKHFEALLPAFEDKRYIRIDDKPLFQVLIPKDIPDPAEFTDTFRELAQANGLPGLFIVATVDDEKELKAFDYDACVSNGFNIGLRKLLNGTHLTAHRVLQSRILGERLRNLLGSQVPKIDYQELINEMKLDGHFSYELIPCVVPNWDNTPRSGPRGTVVTGSTPKLFEKHLQNAVDYVQKYPEARRLVFIKLSTVARPLPAAPAPPCSRPA